MTAPQGFSEIVMMANAIAYLFTFVTFVAADMIWLGIMAPRFYRPSLGDIALTGVNFPAAVLFYAIYPVGLLIFAINPALKSGLLSTAAVYGALFGFFTYATYDLTNQATLRNWTSQLTLVDMAWGTTLGALTSVAAFLVVSKLFSAA